MNDPRAATAAPHETMVRAGTVNEFWYASHYEAVFIIEGEGEITDTATGETRQLRPGSMYLLNERRHHYGTTSRNAADWRGQRRM